MILRRMVSALCLVLLLASGNRLRAEDSSTEAAQKADITWLGLVDSTQYAASWKTAAVMFKTAVSESQWEQAMQAVRAPLGKLSTRKLQKATFATSLPGAPDGSYVVATYQSSFEHKQSAIETITASLEKDGTWRISGYFVN